MLFLRPEALSSVVFLGTTLQQDSTQRRRALGTGFFISVNLSATAAVRYLVTCKHVARALEGAPWFIGVNRKGGPAVWINAEMQPGGTPTKWHYHRTENVDLAVAPMGLSDDLEWRPLPAATLIERQELVGTLEDAAEATLQVEAMKASRAKGGARVEDKLRRFYTGNEVGMVSLFWPHLGLDRIHPIVRIGTLAMIPWTGERTPTSDGPMELILIEARSIGGMSGSPAIIVESHIGDAAEIRLLGVVRGHWELPPSRKNATDDFTVAGDGAASHDAASGDDKVNMGIASVVPGWRLRELLDQPDLAQGRAVLMKVLEATAATQKEAGGALK